MGPTTKSAEWYARALKVLVEGVSSPSRGRVNYEPYPIFMERAKGCRLYDVDGNEYIDLMLAYGALPLGHAHPRIVETVREAIAGGSLFATASAIEVEVAEKLVGMIPGAERVRFANTGTEAAMAAIRLARGVTGRSKFIKFEGHYHGWYDDFLLSSHPHPITSLGHPHDPITIPDTSGVPLEAFANTIVVPWNDSEALARAIDSHAGQIAAVVTEGTMANIGVIPPEPGYLRKVRDMTRDQNILLILDETVTGFRVAPGGCAELYDIVPDITTFGKALGCGYPVAAIAGSAEIMDGLRWGGVLHYGTQNAPRLGLHIVKTSLDELTRDDNAGFRRLTDLGERLQKGIAQAIEASGTKAIVQGVGPMLQLMFTERPAIRSYREYCAYVDAAAFKRFAQSLIRRGVYISPSAALHSVTCLAHEDADIDAAVAAIGETLDGLRVNG
jgi:glutamate-1-semialdehyde 2,1-aminomutase